MMSSKALNVQIEYTPMNIAILYKWYSSTVESNVHYSALYGSVQQHPCSAKLFRVSWEDLLQRLQCTKHCWCFTVLCNSKDLH